MGRLFGKKRKRAAASEEMSLNITSMADVFTIILVFLLKSYATGAASVTPSAGMLLPVAQASTPAVEALKVNVSADSVSIEGTPAVTLQKFVFPAQERLPNGASRTLASAIEKERKRQLLIAQANPDVKVDGKIILVADQRTPYETLKMVLASAAIHGFTDFKLAVIQED
jgi:biopolymer transport protein ExbD